MYRLLIAIGMAVAVLAAFGCGSSDSETSSLTKAEFIKQADQICMQVAKQRQADIDEWEAKESFKPKDLDSHLNQAVRDFIGPSLRREAQELEALPVPEGDEEKVQAIVDRLIKIATVLEKKGTEGGAAAGLDDFEQEAAAYGLKVCPNPNPQ